MEGLVRKGSQQPDERGVKYLVRNTRYYLPRITIIIICEFIPKEQK